MLDHLWGGNVSIRKAAWESLPPYPGGRPLSCHMDWELGLRCRFAGLTASFDRELGAVHHQRRDLAGFLRDRRRSVEDRIRVHELYRSQLGPLSLTHFTQDCSPLTRWVITSGWVPVAEMFRIVLTLALRVAIGLRLRTCERRCALDATRLERLS